MKVLALVLASLSLYPHNSSDVATALRTCHEHWECTRVDSLKCCGAICYRADFKGPTACKYPQLVEVCVEGREVC